MRDRSLNNSSTLSKGFVPLNLGTATTDQIQQLSNQIVKSTTSYKSKFKPVLRQSKSLRVITAASDSLTKGF